MNKLKAAIEEYGRWADLSIFIDRIDAHIESDFSHSLENAKALLEAIGKEICLQCGNPLGDTSSINGVMKQTFNSLGFTNSSMVQQVSRSLATIGQQIGDLRNEVGLTSHGKSLDQIRERNNKIDLLTREFLIDTIEIVCLFLIRNFETYGGRVAGELQEDKMKYEDGVDFNLWWDEQFGEFEMGEYSYPASEILFSVDKQAYLNENKLFNESES